MKEINLRELYPDTYNTDTLVEVADEVWAVIRSSQRAEAAYERRKYRHKAHYSLDYGNGIEKAARQPVPTPEELLAIYCGNLENLVNHTDIWSQLSLCDGRGTIYYEQSLTETWENAKTLTSLESKNYCVYGQRDEVVQFLQENSLDSLYVENVRLW